MWIFAKHGFLSLVQHENCPYHLLVRGRVSGDIQNFFPAAQVQRTEKRDYLFRAVLSKEQVAKRIALAVADIDYCGALGTSFKASITDKRRAPYYLNVWDTMAEMQDRLKGGS
jgi:hypothetical protein